jgi:hypothetical protein
MKNITTMTEQEMTDEITKNNDQRNVLFKQKEPIDKKLTKLYKRNESLQNEIDRRKVENAKASKEVDWDYVLQDGHSDSLTHHHYQQNMLCELGLSGMGFHQDTNQAALTIHIYKAEQIERVEKGIMTILPYMKPIKTKKGEAQTFHILDRDCGLHNHWELLHITNKWALVDFRRNNDNIHNFKDLHSALVYIHEEICKPINDED